MRGTILDFIATLPGSDNVYTLNSLTQSINHNLSTNFTKDQVGDVLRKAGHVKRVRRGEYKVRGRKVPAKA